MTAPTLNKALIEAMKSKIPDGTGLANVLINILHIGKEAVYRRLRDEVPFTLSEAAIISREIGLSLDSITGNNSTKNALFDLKIIDSTNSIDSIDAYRNIINYYCDKMKTIKYLDNTEIGIAANLIPQIFYLKYPHLAKFRMFKWLYQNEKNNSLCTYSEIHIPDDIRNLQKEYVRDTQYVKKTTYILDHQIFSYLIKDIQYFVNIHLVNEDDVALIKNDLLSLLDDLEKYVTKGKFKTGTDLQVYISNVNFEATYTYISSPIINIAVYRLYSINAVISTDPLVYNYNKNFINSLKKYSTLISESAEIQRIQFFNKQRDIVNTL